MLSCIDVALDWSDALRSGPIRSGEANVTLGAGGAVVAAGPSDGPVLTPVDPALGTPLELPSRAIAPMPPPQSTSTTTMMIAISGPLDLRPAGCAADGAGLPWYW